ncbi:hypothetical protein A2697_00475 [Candidatus Curtissbacteria bacterium RIFCSPHIGHO2_01_FULL_41_44]|uniref:Uncharacterized protein n=1 Tax=Candidatus Curtissbacteria bacterium RIFCSPLOWO2_01_FULL_42_50 TaxID=1797730 RepID=A0A1F5H2F5_9BACT|nr:MAG: hypothetical protein A2697_00475 [Candidatus Curtissbacteria bacterium RIFCSPHIGHO2_01_FULL_41_44]OGD92817.1 MAG: hypothetical protein A3C33_04840 [Candidatus Curtissbacteria bacterium RIFCSPHIGHO2_02_FULL_42_58]OGD96502.1 MAG: hypothetical protein A3E71_00605 [Candidatus Curtissbacteria bacterium RIFCSPHIGHO2_12_FULL_42_33]OGD98244.1 MAG: hypothetical protein A3B54_00375 [Candidatus Curtissbacteria bacterium RIFCSPLOWO2_01_FULL_42_50]OGE02838.1 MAG: hypothetical protein A3G16_05135 [Ca
MSRFLPFTFLIAAASAFGLAWIVVEVDPASAPWFIFTFFVFLLFIFIFCLLGLLLYFLRTRFYKRYSTSWYFKTSFKMAFFVALFVAISATLAILQQVTTFNIVLTILAIGLLAFWSYLGKKAKRPGSQ